MELNKIGLSGPPADKTQVSRRDLGHPPLQQVALRFIASNPAQAKAACVGHPSNSHCEAQILSASET